MKTEKHEEMKRNEVCCESFRAISHRFNWMSYTDEEDGKTVFVMPHITEQCRIRVSYCPICGKLIRSINLTDLF